MIKIHYHFSFKPDQYHKNNNHTIDDHAHQLVQNNLAAAAAPSPWLVVPLPVQCIAEFVKNRLPVVQYRDFIRIKTGQPEADEPSNNNMRIVCMNSMEGSQVCLDFWIDEGQLTCPLCRSELVPNSTPKTKDHKEMGDFEEDDPWRAESMVYLFDRPEN
ncbi:hypothetical protein PRUPE_2G319200 [Prunus persica]|uniref:Uncharacterized protein n=1 Tax=Prunus persica TaxID=3760 RepID=A0A251QPU5_PRUPE|nr:hypothetical protein PRUPE_2G319200 [Prunus persica]